jgi:hypothetical protein
MTTQQIKQRLLFIIEDANRLLNHIESGKGMEESTAFADSAWTHLSNIQIAADPKDTESEAWKSQSAVLTNKIFIMNNTERFARICSATNEGMNEGFVFQDGLMYFKHEQDLVTYLRSREEVPSNLSDEFLLKEAYDLEEYYYTEWDYEDEGEWYEKHDGVWYECTNDSRVAIK